jgi:hypothetical protein
LLHELSQHHPHGSVCKSYRGKPCDSSKCTENSSMQSKYSPGFSWLVAPGRNKCHEIEHAIPCRTYVKIICSIPEAE